MISSETEAMILRYFHAEHWKVGTIARQLHIHHSVVRRVLGLRDDGMASRPLRAQMIDPYLPFVLKTLEEYPTLRATRLYEMVRKRGFVGSQSHFRRVIRRHRPARRMEAYLRLRMLPGECAQCDWGSFGHLMIGRARRPLSGFVMVLAHSRDIYLRFFLDMRMENFQRGHLGAFARWGGCPRIVQYDNLRSAVLERHGDIIRFNPAIIELARHYHFEPRPCDPGRGNQKGRVERAIRYIRDSFFAARAFTDLDDLNRQAEAWCNGLACERRWVEDPAMTVGEAFARERASLLALPDIPYPVRERVEVRAGKTPYVRFDGNDYSIPHTHVGRTLTVLAEPERVRVVDGSCVLAIHPRSYDKGRQIEAPAHIEALVQEKRKARAAAGADRLTHAAPSTHELLTQAAEQGDSLGGIVAQLLGYLDRYGATELEAATAEALKRGVPHPNAVRLALERRREEQARPLPVVLMPHHIRAHDVAVRSADLKAYDELRSGREEDDHE